MADQSTHPRSRRNTLALPLSVALALTLVVAPVSAESEPGPCGAPAGHPGGDWPSYGGDLANSRSQPLEDTIGPDTVGDLEVAWAFPFSEHGGGDTHTTPVVADGCVYVVPSSATAFALNADTGEVVWSTELDASPGGYGGAVVGAPAVAGDQLVVVINRGGSPYLAGLDREDGQLLWTTVIDETPTAITNASVTVYDGLAFIGFSGSSGGTPMERGGFVIVDTGDVEEGEDRLLAKTWTVSDEDYEAGYGGASIWSTAAVDQATGYAYVGTGNPHSDRVEPRNANSIIKVDLNREHATFGEIVGVYKGNSDQYIDGLDRQPACQDLPPVYYFASFDASCVQLDLDIGASPNLFTDDHGNLMVGALQKSGVYHAAYADGMSRGWSRVLGAPCFACNAASAAYDGERIFAAAVPPGQLWALDTDFGDYQWVSPLGDGLHYQSVSTANGVVYTMIGTGHLGAFEAETGLPLARRSTSTDASISSVAVTASYGIAIARNTVYAGAGGGIIAYRLP